MDEFLSRLLKLVSALKKLKGDNEILREEVISLKEDLEVAREENNNLLGRPLDTGIDKEAYLEYLRDYIELIRDKEYYLRQTIELNSINTLQGQDVEKLNALWEEDKTKLSKVEFKVENLLLKLKGDV